MTPRGLIVGVSGENSIGFACARAMRANGAEVAVTYRSARDGVPSLADTIGALAVPLDLEDPASAPNAFSNLERVFGRLDFIVHTAMHVPPGVLSQPLVDLDRDAFMRVLDIGVYSLISICNHARTLLARSDAPRVVAITSPCAHRMAPHYHVAGIAKAALEAAVRYLAHDLGPAGILCNAVSPGLIDTDGAVAVVGADIAVASRAHMAKRAATRRATGLDDVAACVAWLCSPGLRNITGEVITVDGGHARAYF